MKTNQNGIEIIKHFEGLELSAYRDAVGIFTIGYGHTKNVIPGQVTTKEQADLWLIEDVFDAEHGVLSLVKSPLSSNQFSSLVSFVFNLGAGRFGGSTLLRIINDKQYDAAPQQFKKWVYAGKNKLTGLVARRHAEAVLWGLPDDKIIKLGNNGKEHTLSIDGGKPIALG